MTPPDERMAPSFTIRGPLSTPDDPEGQPIRLSFIRAEDGSWEGTWFLPHTGQLGRFTLPPGLPGADTADLIAQAAAQRDQTPR
jgi:hypothetical protein